MGGREVGGLANLLSAHRDMANPAHRAEVAALWGVPSVPDKPGKTAVEMFQAAADGEIKALWIACTNPAQSMPDQATVRRALQRAELRGGAGGVRHHRHLRICRPAAARHHLGREGRHRHQQRAAHQPRAPGRARARASTRHDWAIATEFAQRLEARLRPGPPPVPLPADRPGPRSGLERAPRIHPRPRPGHHRHELRHAGGRGPSNGPCGRRRARPRPACTKTACSPPPDGRARFATLPTKPVAEPRDARYPFSLTTGRLRDQWHGMSRTGTLGRLFGHVAEPAVQMNPQDMAAPRPEGRRAGARDQPAWLHRGAGAGQHRRGPEPGLHGHALGPRVPGRLPSTASGWRGSTRSPRPRTAPAPNSPSSSTRPSRCCKAELPWSLLGVAWLPEGEALAAREALKPLMALFPFASCVPFGRERSGVLFRAASYEAPPDEVLAALKRCWAWQGPTRCATPTKRKGQHRAMRLVRHGASRPAGGFVLAGDTRAEAWIKTLLQDELPAQAYGRLLLLPGAKRPGGRAVARQTGVHLLQCERARHPGPPGRLQRQRRRAPGVTAGRTEMRHQLRQLRARAAPHGDGRHSLRQAA
jgi:assimilatory nitrate reductase catalytic subunit